MQVMWMVVAAMASACAGDPPKAAPPPKRPAPPSSSFTTTELDALWALAPETARLGVVVAPSGLAKLERTYAVIDKLSGVPELADYKARLDGAIEALFGTRSFAFATAGMSPAKGWAYFELIDGAAITILPVVDRDKFLAARHGTKGADGTDTLDSSTCRTVKDVYACATSPASLDELGNGTLAEIRKLAGARGDVEVAGTIPMLGGGAAVMQLDPGAVTLRAAIKNIPARSKQLLANAKPPAVGDSTSSFGVLGVGSWELLTKMPPTPVVAGVTVDALAKSVRGPLTLTGEHGATMLEIQLPLSDGDPARKLVAQCDQLPPLARVGATVKDGTCHVKLPQDNFAIDAWVDGNTLRLGTKSATTKPVAVPLSPLARELASGAWSVALYGRGSMFGPAMFQIPVAEDLRQQVGGRMFAIVNELGIGIRLDGDVVRAVVGVRTIWSNPDDVVTKLLAIPQDDVNRGTAGRLAKPIADAAPQIPFANDYKLGSSGIIAATGMMGVLFSVGVPAFFDTMKVARKPEAVTELERIAENAATAHAAKGSFPKGTVGPSPAKTCCGTDNNRCLPDAATWSVPLWKTLGFAMTEPHLFRYAYASDGKTFTATARSDLDCNGDEAVWTMTGTIEAGKPVTNLVPPAKGHY